MHTHARASAINNISVIIYKMRYGVWCGMKALLPIAAAGTKYKQIVTKITLLVKRCAMLWAILWSIALCVLAVVCICIRMLFVVCIRPNMCSPPCVFAVGV